VAAAAVSTPVSYSNGPKSNLGRNKDNPTSGHLQLSQVLRPNSRSVSHSERNAALVHALPNSPRSASNDSDEISPVCRTDIPEQTCNGHITQKIITRSIGLSSRTKIFIFETRNLYEAFILAQ
jgi:hypothetical protein